MGTCCSKEQHESPPPVPHPPYRNQSRGGDRDPPPTLPHFEEETVKEVLSETPKPSFLPNLQQQQQQQQQRQREAEAEEKVQISKNNSRKSPILTNGRDEPSDVSEICSLSETMSFSTATITDRRGEYNDNDEEDDDEVGTKPKNPVKIQKRRPGVVSSADHSARRDLSRRSPSKRLEPSPSPVKRRSSREAHTNRAWIPAGNNTVRRDLGENSARRSRSPTAARSKNCPSPRRVPAEDGIRKPEGNSAPDSAPAACESLENPLVSLECFIFL